MYVLLSGAKKNVGDFLIVDRAKQLVSKYRRTDDLVVIPRWSRLDPHIDMINRSRGLVICGGPVYSRQFYPNVLPLVDDLDRIKVPIVPIGLGLGVGETTESIEKFEFTADARSAIDAIHDRIPWSGVRDTITERTLHRLGVTKVTTSGCPAWYHLPTVEDGFTPPDSVRSVVVTTPAENHNFGQVVQVLRLIRRKFPHARRYVVFHRGIFPGRHTAKRPAINNTLLAARGWLNGWRVVDASYRLERIDFYEQCDLHVGYRVHAHIDFLSLRKPSVLIQEDIRGVGQSEALGTQDVLARDPGAIAKLDQILEHHLATGFEDFQQPVGVMQDRHTVMRELIESF